VRTETFVREIDIRGKQIKVYLDDGGLFLTREPELRHVRSWEDLRKRLLDLTKKATTRLEIPITAAVGQKLIDGIARGRHGGNRNVLIQWAGKMAAEQEGNYYHSTYFPRLTAEEKAEWTRLSEASQRASKAFADWVESHEIEIRKVVDEALNAAVLE
jgi:hypothetical protein